MDRAPVPFPGTAHPCCRGSTAVPQHRQHPHTTAVLLPATLPSHAPGVTAHTDPPAALPGLPEQLLTTRKGGPMIFCANSPCWVNKCALCGMMHGERPHSPPSPAPRGVRLHSSAALAEGRGLMCTDKVESLCFSAIKQLRSFYTRVLSGLMCLVEQEKNHSNLAGKAASALQAPTPSPVPQECRHGAGEVICAWVKRGRSPQLPGRAPRSATHSTDPSPCPASKAAYTPIGDVCV